MACSKMINCFTNGTVGALSPDTNKPITFIPANEDYSFLGIILQYNSASGVAQVKKLWDIDTNPKVFYVWLKYSGRTGVVDALDAVIGSLIIVCRTGDFNSHPGYTPQGFELHEENSNKVSFVGLV